MIVPTTTTIQFAGQQFRPTPAIDKKLHAGHPSTWVQAAHWDYTAAAYDRAAGRASKTVATHIIKLAHARQPFNAPGNYAIDLGAGTGALSLSLAQRFPGLDILATDISSAMLAQLSARRGKQLALTEAPNHLGMRRLDMTAPCAAGGEPAGKFSHALSTFALQQVPKPAAAVEGAYRLLRDGGVVAFGIWDLEGHCAPLAIWEEAARMADPAYASPPLSRPGKWLGPAPLVDAMRAAGFRDVALDTFHCPLDIGVDGFMQFWWESGNPFPAERIRTFDGDLNTVKAAMRHILKHKYQDGNAIFIDCALVIAHK